MSSQQNPQTRIVLFQGDSITDACRQPEHGNDALRLGNGYVFLIAAAHGLNHPAQRMKILNRGRSGDTVQAVLERWEADCLVIKPDVVSLLIGVNDAMRMMRGIDYPHDEFEANFRKILELTREALPGCKIVLGEPFLVRAGEVTDAWMEEIRLRQVVVRKLAGEFADRWVPLQEPFDQAASVGDPAYWAYDGVHPTSAGFALLAREWERRAGDLLMP